MFFPRFLAVSLTLASSTFSLAQEAKPSDTKPNDAVIAVPRDAKWKERHELINSRVKAGPIDLVFIGDSITQGWEGGGKKVWEEFYSKRKAANLGIGGDRTQHVLWRLDNGNIEGIKPKLAVVMIGTNNSGNNSSEQIAAGVKAIVEKLQAKTPETKILLLAIFPRGANADDARRKVNQGANALIAKMADDKKVFYLDFGAKFLKEDGTLSKEIMPDLLHLNEKSYRIWAEAIEPQVAQFLGESKS
jgi:lysophospholipase L1-like esterase